MKGGKRVELTTGEHTIARERRAIVHRAGTKVDPNVPILACPHGTKAAGIPGRGGVSAGGGRSVGVLARLRAEVEQVDVDGLSGAGASERAVVLGDEHVDERVGNAGERVGVEGRGGFVEVRADGVAGGVGELGRGDGAGDVEVEGVGDREAVRAAAGEEGGGGYGGVDEGGERPPGGGREGVPREADVDRDGGGEGEEAGGEERGRGGERAAEAGGEGGEGVVAGGWVARRRRREEGVEARERGRGCGWGEERDKEEDEEG